MMINRAIRLVFPAWTALAAFAPVVRAQAPRPQDSSRVVEVPLASRIFHNTRTLRVYLPPGYESDSARRYPLLILNDGFAVFSPRAWHARRTLDSLVEGKLIPPLVVVGIDNAATIAGSKDPSRDRTIEFQPYPDSTEPDIPHPRGLEYPEFVVNEVLPLVTRQFRVEQGREHTGIGGSSLGGIAALVTAIHFPQLFGSLLLESTPLFLFHERLTGEMQSIAVWPTTIYLGVGTRETDDAAVMRAGRIALDRFAETVRQFAPNTRLWLNVVEGAQHTGSAWGARLPEALMFIYGAKKPTFRFGAPPS